MELFIIREVRHGLDGSGKAWRGGARRGLARMALFLFAWFGMVRFGGARSGLARQHMADRGSAWQGKDKKENPMNASENRNNTYLAISFITGIFWSAPFVWLAPKLAIWVGMAVVVIVYSTLCFFGNSADA